jgi:CP family cyanate transporter-like MFS transporter
MHRRTIDRARHRHQSQSRQPVADIPEPRLGRGWPVIGLVLLAINLRIAITSVSPVLDELRATLGLSAAAAGVLTALPVLCLGGFATLAPPLARRFGPEVTLTGALALIAAGVALRAVPSPLPLFAGMTLAGTGIAIGNVLLPYVVKRNFAGRIGPYTGLATMLMAIGAATGAALTIPLMELSGGLPVALGLWALPALLGLAVWLRLAIRRPASERAAAGSLPKPSDSPQNGSLLRDPLAWQVTGFMGLQSLMFYVTVSWLPAVLGAEGMAPGPAGVVLSLMMLFGIPTGLVVPVLAARLRTQSLLILVVTLDAVIGVAGLLAAPSLAWLWAIIIGIGTGSAFPIAITLLSLRSDDSATAARLSGMAQTAGYLLAGTGPLTFGLLHDLTGDWDVPLVVLLILLLAQAGIGWLAGRDRVVRVNPR